LIELKSKREVGSVAEIYTEINRRQIAALMIHSQMANYFDFLGLHGYKRLHEYQYYAEMAENRLINRYYINHHNQLIEDADVGEVSVIPAAWYKADRMVVGKSTKQKAVEDAFTQYRAWEVETKEVYEHYAVRLREIGKEADALRIDCLVKDVDRELKKLDRMMIDLISTGYDIVYIVDSQHDIHEKYRKKTEKVLH
jgi:hypothetical protein